MKEGEYMAKRKQPISPLIQEYRHQRRRIQQFMRRAEKRGYQFSPNALPDRPKRITEKSVKRLQELTPEKLYKKAQYGGEASYGEVIKGTQGRKLERKLSAEKARQTRLERKQVKKYEPDTFELPTTHTEDTSEFQGYGDYDYDDYEYQPEPEVKKTIDDLKREAKLNFIKGEERVSQDTSFFSRVVVSNFKLTLNAYNELARNKLNSWLNTLVSRFGEEQVAQMITQAMEDGVELTVKDSYFTEKVSDYMQKMMDYLPEAGEFTKAEIMEALEEEELYEEPI